MLHYHTHFRKIIQGLVLSLVCIFSFFIYFHSDTSILQDMGRHLTLGRIIWDTRQVPSTNLFSYTYPDFPFFNHHWGSEVVFFLIHSVTGINGLILLSILLMLTGIGLLSVFTLKKSAIVAFLVSEIITLEILRERIDIRPEMFGYFFFCVMLWILYREKERSGKLIWVIPTITLLWINLHISFVFAGIVYACFLFDRLLAGKLQKAYIYILVLMIVFSGINPHGIMGILYPLNIFNNYGYPITENQSPFFLQSIMNDPTILYYEIGLGLSLILSPILLWKKRIFEVLLMVATSMMAYSAIRHFPFYALASLYPLSLGLTMIENSLKKWLTWVVVVPGIILSMFFIYQIYGLVSNSFYANGYQLQKTGLGQVDGGRKLVDYFLENKLHGPIFNNFDIGSYLIYRLYPQDKVFVDGRPEAYPSKFFTDTYIPMQYDQSIWEEQQKKYQFKVVIVSHTDATPWGRTFLQRIIKDPQWIPVYFDDWGVMFLHNEEHMQSVHSLMDKDTFDAYAHARMQSTNEASLLARYANFFQIIGREDLFKEAVGKLKSSSL